MQRIEWEIVPGVKRRKSELFFLVFSILWRCLLRQHFSSFLSQTQSRTIFIILKFWRNKMFSFLWSLSLSWIASLTATREMKLKLHCNVFSMRHRIIKSVNENQQPIWWEQKKKKNKQEMKCFEEDEIMKTMIMMMTVTMTTRRITRLKRCRFSFPIFALVYCAHHLKVDSWISYLHC